jgi:hypothetical protein
VIDIDVIDKDMAVGDAGVRDFVIHAVDAPQQGGFAAS